MQTFCKSDLPILDGFTVLALAVLIRDRLEVNSKSFSRSSWLTELDAMFFFFLLKKLEFFIFFLKSSLLFF